MSTRLLKNTRLVGGQDPGAGSQFRSLSLVGALLTSHQKLSSREPISANCYIVLVAMSTEFILENSASLGPADELKWFLVPQLVVTATMAAFQKEKEKKNIYCSVFFPLASNMSSCDMRREVFFALFFTEGWSSRPPLEFLNLQVAIQAIPWEFVI